jgi:hypothetical protein
MDFGCPTQQRSAECRSLKHLVYCTTWLLYRRSVVHYTVMQKRSRSWFSLSSCFRLMCFSWSKPENHHITDQPLSPIETRPCGIRPCLASTRVLLAPLLQQAKARVTWSTADIAVALFIRNAWFHDVVVVCSLLLNSLLSFHRLLSVWQRRTVPSLCQHCSADIIQSSSARAYIWSTCDQVDGTVFLSPPPLISSNSDLYKKMHLWPRFSRAIYCRERWAV